MAPQLTSRCCDHVPVIRESYSYSIVSKDLVFALNFEVPTTRNAIDHGVIVGGVQLMNRA
jgi:hypothetical protein